MARVVGSFLFMLGLVAVIGFSLGNVKTVAEAAPGIEAETPDDETTDDETTDDEATQLVPDQLGFTAPPAPRVFAELDVSRWASGTYLVGESSDPAIVAIDRDVEPREPPLGDDPRLNGDVFGGDNTPHHTIIRPGLYSTEFNVEDCTYSLWHVERASREGAVIGEEYLAAGRLIVSINGIEPDWFQASTECGDWFEWRPRPEPQGSMANGDYWHGDVAEGRWLVPDACIWEKVATFRGGLLRDVIESGRGPAILEIDAEPVGLRIRGCREPVTFIG